MSEVYKIVGRILSIIGNTLTLLMGIAFAYLLFTGKLAGSGSYTSLLTYIIALVVAGLCIGGSFLGYFTTFYELETVVMNYVAPIMHVLLGLFMIYSASSETDMLQSIIYVTGAGILLLSGIGTAIIYFVEGRAEL